MGTSWGTGGRVSFSRTQPYNDLPSLPPSAQVETLATLKKAIGANRALAELKGAGNVIPDQTILLSTLVLQEARLSSEIENIVTTNDRLYRALGDDDGRHDASTKEVLRYHRALRHGCNRLQAGVPLSPSLLEELVTIIRQHEAGVRTLPGTLIASLGGETIYTPPDGEERLRGLLANLAAYIHAEDGVDPLIKTAVIHYQFEAIHPFTDGNGRTGRILNILYLVSQGLLDQPVLYLSRYIIQNRAAYYQGLKRVTEQQEWEEWILYMLDAIGVTAAQTCQRIHAIRKLLDEVLAKARAEVPKVYSKELIELLFEQPYCRIASVVDACGVQRQTASVYLQELERIGLLSRLKAGREVFYVNDRLLRVLAE
jgi:Fic family protein